MAPPLAALLVFAAVLQLASTHPSALAAPRQRLAVYYLTSIPAQDRERALKSDDALTEVAPTVFGKLGEFDFVNQSDPAPFILVPAPYARKAAGYEPAYALKKSDRGTFKYRILALDGKWSAGALANASVGVVDEVPRQDVKDYVRYLLHGKAPKSIKRVNKVDDLFPLMALGNVDVILIPPDELSEVRKRFQSKTYEVGDSAEVAYPVVCAKKGTSSEDRARFLKVSKDTLERLGFTGISKYEPKGGP